MYEYIKLKTRAQQWSVICHMYKHLININIFHTVMIIHCKLYK